MAVPATHRQLSGWCFKETICWSQNTYAVPYLAVGDQDKINLGFLFPGTIAQVGGKLIP